MPTNREQFFAPFIGVDAQQLFPLDLGELEIAPVDGAFGWDVADRRRLRAR